jgi:hypothetical protein
MAAPDTSELIRRAKLLRLASDLDAAEIHNRWERLEDTWQYAEWRAPSAKDETTRTATKMGNSYALICVVILATFTAGILWSWAGIAAVSATALVVTVALIPIIRARRIERQNRELELRQERLEQKLRLLDELARRQKGSERFGTEIGPFGKSTHKDPWAGFFKEDKGFLTPWLDRKKRDLPPELEYLWAYLFLSQLPVWPEWEDDRYHWRSSKYWTWAKSRLYSQREELIVARLLLLAESEFLKGEQERLDRAQSSFMGWLRRLLRNNNLIGEFGPNRLRPATPSPPDPGDDSQESPR